MVKIIGLVLIAVYGLWFFTVKAPDVSIDDIQEQEISGETEVKLTQAQMHDTIKATAEKEGWLTTEFKTNTLIAEKTIQNNSTSVTITFSKSYFSISPENTDLKNAINSALNI